MKLAEATERFSPPRLAPKKRTRTWGTGQIFFGTNAPGSLGGTSCPTTVGNIMHRKYDFHPGNGDNGNVYAAANCRDTSRNQNFDYDNLNRIRHGYTNGSTTAIKHWGETFTLDAWGNLTNIGGYAGKPNHENLNAAPANVKNQLPSFGYDAAGNMTSNGSATYTYDAENRLTATTATAGYSYLYDGDGKRVKKCANANCGSGTLYWTGTGDDPLQGAPGSRPGFGR